MKTLMLVNNKAGGHRSDLNAEVKNEMFLRTGSPGGPAGPGLPVGPFN